MNYEIERKFLLKNKSWKKGLTVADSSFIQQAYLSVHPDPTVRIRIRDAKAWITIKSKAEGIGRAEFEYPIPHTDALELMKLARFGLVVKRRYLVKHQNMTWELDEYFGENEGLFTAELELDHEDAVFDKPGWLGEEVSMDPRYSNSSLAMNPYKNWE